MKTCKPFSELTREAMNGIFQCKNGEVNHEINESIQNVITAGISKALHHSLNPVISGDPRSDLIIGPFTYNYSTFKLTDPTELYTNLDQYKKEPIKNTSQIERIRATINDNRFIDAVMHYCKLDEYDVETGKWISPEEEPEYAVDFDKYAAEMAIGIHVFSILHILLCSKSTDVPLVFELPGEGIYTIEYEYGQSDSECVETARESFKIGFGLTAQQ